MGGTGKKPEKGKTTKDGGKKPPPKIVEDDEDEDGDFATPKRDRDGDDDQPFESARPRRNFSPSISRMLWAPSRCAPQPFFDSVAASLGSTSKASATIASGTALIQSWRTGVNSSMLSA